LKKQISILFNLLVLTAILFVDLSTTSNNPVLYQYRFNRDLSAIVSGVLIGLSGVLLQSSLRNPLVDHYVIGIGSGALAFTYLSILLMGGYTVAVAMYSMTGGLVALLLTIILAEKLSGSEVSYVLAGIAINSVFSGLSTILSYIAVREYPYAQLLLVGSFMIATSEKLMALLLVMVFATIVLAVVVKALNVIEVSDEFSVVTGYSPRITRLIAVVTAGLSSSVVTSMYGLIGFIGVASPHIARLLVKSGDNRVVAPLAGTVSALVLLSTDLVSRRIFTAVWGEIPAGTVASLIGAPFFIYLLVSRRGR